MSDIVLSTYQKNIIEYFKNNPQSNIKVNALAGSAKSFTACRMLEDTDAYSLYVAFNKSIQEEFSNKISNPKVKVYTLHSLGLQVLNNNLSSTNVKSKGIGISASRPQEGILDNLKVYGIVDTIFNNDLQCKKDPTYKNFLRDNYYKLYNLIRLKFIDLKNEYTEYHVAQTIKDQNLFLNKEFNKDISEIVKVLRKIDAKSLELFEEEQRYDFTDMLYITLKKLMNYEWKIPGWLYFFNIVVDECQDLSTIQILLIGYFLRKGGRLVFIGDDYQSIYGFAGANYKSSSLIGKIYSPLKEFDLPINYRCPTKHLEYVKKEFNINIIPRKDAPTGKIIKVNQKEMIDLVKPGDFVISRFKKSFMPVVIDLVSRGIPVYIRDENFVTQIKNKLERSKCTSILDLKYNIKNEENRIKKDLQGRKKPKDGEELSEEEVYTEDNTGLDIYSAVKLLIDAFQKKNSTFSMSEFKKYVGNLLNGTDSKDSVYISSIHCIKGLEAKNVFVLNEAKVVNHGELSEEQRVQERNLSYIALTRAEENLYLVKGEEK